MKEQNQGLTTKQKEYSENTAKKSYDLKKELEKTQQARMDLEAELRKLQNELNKALQEHYEHKMFQEGEKKTEEELKNRHDLEV